MPFLFGAFGAESIGDLQLGGSSLTCGFLSEVGTFPFGENVSKVNGGATAFHRLMDGSQ